MYIWNLEKRYWWTYLQGRNRDTDIENELVDTVGAERMGWTESRIDIYTLCCCCTATKSCPTVCDSMNCSMPSFPALDDLPESAQTHVHWVSDAIQPPHPLSSPSSLALNLSQHQGLFQWVSFSHQVAKVLELQHQSFHWTPRTDLLQIGLVGSPCSPRDSQESSPTPQFKSINSLVLSLLHCPTLTPIHDYWKNHSLEYADLCWQSDVSAF